MKLTFITGNAGKAEAMYRYLGMPIDHEKLDLDEIQSLDLEEIVKDKVTRAYEIVKKPVIVEDVSFVFHAYNKLPGPFIKWFLKELGNDGLCHLLHDKDRKCVATVCYGLHDGKEIKLFSGSMEGTVAMSPKGSNGFGWASVFIPDGYDKTYAEMTHEEQSPISMRNIALKKLREYLV